MLGEILTDARRGATWNPKKGRNRRLATKTPYL
jgi:hypothetical protein